jgi:hypothetical protein
MEPAAMEPTAGETAVTAAKAAMAATTKAAATAVATTTAPAAAARQGGVWLRKYQNARERRYSNSQAACDANAFHADPLLSVAAGLAAKGAGFKAGP